MFGKTKMGPGITVFLLFFATSVLEAFRRRDLGDMAFWVIIGMMFLVADFAKKDYENR